MIRVTREETTKKTTKVFARSIAVVCASLLVAQSASAFIIDSFNVLVAETVTSVGSPVSHVSTGPSVLGTYRDIAVDMDVGSSYVEAKILPNQDVLYYSQGAGAKGEMVIQWDGDNTSGNLSYEQELAKLSGSYLTMRVWSEYAGQQLTVNMFETSGAMHNWTKTSVAGTQDLIFNYNAANNGGLQVGDSIGAVQLVWQQGTAPVASDASFEWFGQGDPREVPEPGTMALMGALFGLGGFSRLRKRLMGVKQSVMA